MKVFDTYHLCSLARLLESFMSMRYCDLRDRFLDQYLTLIKDSFSCTDT